MSRFPLALPYSRSYSNAKALQSLQGTISTLFTFGIILAPKGSIDEVWEKYYTP
jgi:hypothetical protein